MLLALDHAHFDSFAPACTDRCRVAASEETLILRVDRGGKLLYVLTFVYLCVCVCGTDIVGFWHSIGFRLHPSRSNIALATLALCGTFSSLPGSTCVLLCGSLVCRLSKKEQSRGDSESSRRVLSLSLPTGGSPTR